MAVSDFLNVPLTSGSTSAFSLIAQALAGQKRVEVFIDGDSRMNAAAESGKLVKAAFNAAILQLSANGIVDTGWTVVDAVSNYTTQMPIRTAAPGAITVAAPVAKLPARWPEIAMSAYAAAAGNGHFFNLNSDGENVDPSLGCGAGAQTTWWPRTEGETYVYVACLCSQETVAGGGANNYSDEITVRVTPTDTIHTGVTASPAQTFTTGASGVPALNLRSNALSEGVVKIARIGPITFNNGSLRRVCQINVTSATTGQRANVMAAKFSRETASGPIPGLSVSVIGQKSGHRIGGATQSHLVTNNDAGQAYLALTSAIAGAQSVYALTANINDIYLDSATAATTAGYARDRIAQMRSWIGSVPAFVMSHPDRCLASAADAQSDLLPAAFHSAFGDKSSGVGVLNYRRHRHQAGYNRGSEFSTGPTLTIPQTLATNVFDGYSATLGAANLVRGLGGRLGAVRSKSATTNHPYATHGLEYAACLQHVAVNGGVLDPSHDSPMEAYPGAMAVLSMALQAAATAPTASAWRGGR